MNVYTVIFCYLLDYWFCLSKAWMQIAASGVLFCFALFLFWGWGVDPMVWVCAQNNIRNKWLARADEQNITVMSKGNLPESEHQLPQTLVAVNRSRKTQTSFVSRVHWLIVLLSLRVGASEGARTHRCWRGFTVPGRLWATVNDHTQTGTTVWTR